jgi:hypothetical protein
VYSIFVVLFDKESHCGKLVSKLIFCLYNFARINVFLSMKSLCFSMGGSIRKSEFSPTSKAILQVACVEETQDIQRQFNCYRNILLPVDASLSTMFATTVQIIRRCISYSISYSLCAESHRRHDAAIVFIFKFRMKI